MFSPVVFRAAALSSAGALYASLGGNAGASPNGAASVAGVVMPEAGELSALTILLSAGPAAAGTGAGYSFTYVLNGVDTGIGVTILETDTTATDATGRLAYAAGDTVSIRCAPVNGPTGQPTLVGACECNATGQPLLSAGLTAPTSAAASYSGLQNGTATAALHDAIIPTPGTLDAANLKLTTSPGAGKSWTATLVLNGVDTGIVLTVAGGTGALGASSAGSVHVVPGDRVRWRIDPAGSPGSSRILLSCRWTPDTPGEAILTHGSGNSPSNTGALNYSGPGSGIGYTSANIRAGLIAGNYTLRSMYAAAGVAPGPGASWTFTARHGSTSAGGLTNLAVTVADPATAGSDFTDTVDVVAGELWNVTIVGAALPVQDSTGWGLVAYRAPAGGPNYVDAPTLDVASSSSLAGAGTVDVAPPLLDVASSSRLEAPGTVDALLGAAAVGATSDLGYAGTLLTGPPLVDVAGASGLGYAGTLLTGPAALDVASSSGLAGAGTVLEGLTAVDVASSSDLAGAGTVLAGPALVDVDATSDLAVTPAPAAGAPTGPGHFARGAAGHIARSPAGHIGTM